MSGLQQVVDVDPFLRRSIDAFRDRVIDDPTQVLDPEDIHHEFVSGMHGRKLDFDKIPTGSDFYLEWVGVYGRFIQQAFSPRNRSRRPDAIVGIANGANRLAEDTANFLGDGMIGLTTEKVDAKTVRLNEAALEAIAKNNIRFVVLGEDVGTTGGTMSTVVPGLREAGVQRIEAATTWQRTPTLGRLEDKRIPYTSMIPEVLPTFSPEECAQVAGGYCLGGSQLIPHGQ